VAAVLRGLGFDRGLYYLAKFTGQVAQALLMAALFVVAGTGSHSALGLSSMFLAIIVPAVLFGLPGGALAERIGPARGFAFGAVLRFGSAALAIVVLHGAASAWAVAFLYSLLSQVHTPAELALVRTLRGGSSGPIHSSLIGLQYGGQAAGTLALAPALYYLGGTQAMVAGAAAIFLAFAVLCIVLCIRIESDVVLLPRARHPFNFRETLSVFSSQRLAREAMTVLAVKAMVTQGIVVALPLYLRNDMALGGEALMFLLMPGIAGVLAGLTWSRSCTRLNAGGAMRLALLGMATALFALAALDYGLTAVIEFSQIPRIASLEASLNTTFVVALPVAFLVGASIAVGLVSARVALTESAPLAQQARVFAAQATLTDGIVVLPLLLMGVGVQVAGARPVMAAMGALAVVALATIQAGTARRSSPVTAEVSSTI
jgi:hypothetical protein